MDTPPLVVVAAFTNVHEANLALSVLDAAGINAMLDNEHVISMDWTLSNAVGGVRVLVGAEKADEARELLATAASDLAVPPGVDTPPASGDSCDNCGSAEFDSEVAGRRLSIASWMTIGLPLGVASRRRFCRRCGATVKRGE
jgi:hypothetical protein